MVKICRQNSKRLLLIEYNNEKGGQIKDLLDIDDLDELENEFWIQKYVLWGENLFDED